MTAANQGLQKRVSSGRWSCLMLVFTVGCTGSVADELREQEASLRGRYEQEKRMKTKLTAKQKRVLQDRLRMQYGDVAE